MRARNLKFWLQEEHGIDFSVVDIRDSPLEGLGTFAVADVKGGEVVFEVPKSCCIYPELVFEDRQLGKTMKKLADVVGAGIEVIALATFLAREKMMGTQSSYQPYIEVLPWDTALHPLLWTEPEVDLLQGTYAYDQLQDLRQQVDAATQLFEPVLNPQGWKAVFQPMESERMSSEAFGFLMRGAFASVLSRAFDSDLGGSRGGESGLEQRVLIPLMDSFNHDNDGNPSIKFDATITQKTGHKVVVTAAEGGVRAGEEMAGFYGNKPNWQMLANYGFVSTNPECQEATLEDSLCSSDALYARKAELLARLGLSPSSQLFDLQVTQEPSELLFAYQRIAVISDPQELDGAEKAGEGPLAPVNEKRALARLQTLLDTRRKFIAEAKDTALKAGEQGQETRVRRSVATTVADLLDSEAAAVKSLERRIQIRMAELE